MQIDQDSKLDVSSELLNNFFYDRCLDYICLDYINFSTEKSL